MRAGQLIAGRYRLEEEVGSGGMGVVWRALDQREGQDVALKRAARGTGTDGERTRRRLRREAQIVAGLHHPHIVAFLDEVAEGPEHWLVMEYVPSQSLARMLERTGPLRPHHATHIGAQIAGALEAVHARGIVHRDVKPGNILVTADGIAKLTDFGISRPICGDVTVTDAAVISGTVAFLAPEIADGAEPTPASDVFALGASVYTAVEGTPPFGTSDNPLIVLRRAAAGEVRPARQAGPLAPVLGALLRPDPAQRPDAAGARQLLGDLLSTLTSTEGPLRWPVSRPRRARRRALALTGTCVAALLVGAGVLVFQQGWVARDGTGPVLGDPRTADPCSLIDPAALARFGPAIRTPAYGNFNRCDVLVISSGGNPQHDVALELEKPASPKGKLERRGEIQIDRVPEKNGQCQRIVLLADHNRIVITAKPLPPNSTKPLPPTSPGNPCAMADAAADHVIAALGGGVIPRRNPPADAASLAGMDACTMLDSPSLIHVLGSGVRAPEAGFGNWVCRWGASTSDLSVDLRFDRNEPRVPNAKLAGRDAFITPEPGDSDCVTEVLNRKSLDANSAAIDEVVMVTISGPRPMDQLCEPGRELAQAAAAKLRPPS
ncbi:MAG TPA: serine/threonine-protein kinase [Pseudonocardiaceae bacterium]|nr:serine/threonine-protein kinase [Pseudonocardiaceae bacterium]